MFGNIDIKEWRRSLFDQYSPKMRLQDRVKLLDSVAKFVENCFMYTRRVDRDWIHLARDLCPILKFTKNLLCFATMQGVEAMQLIDLLTHSTDLAVNTVCLTQAYCCVYLKAGEVRNEVQHEISQLQQKIKLIDPQLRETSIHVLTAARALSRFSSTSYLGKDHRTVADFIDSLLGLLMRLLDSCYAFLMAPVRDQMLKLHEGVRFLSILLSVRQLEFSALPENMKDRLAVVIIDAGIVICALSVNELKAGLAKETDLSLFHLLKELHFFMDKVAQTLPLTSSLTASSSSLSFPRTNELRSIDFLLENLQDLVSSKADSIAFPMDQIQIVQEDLAFLTTVLEKIAEQRNQNERLEAFWNRAMEVSHKAGLVVDFAMAGYKHEHSLDVVARDINLIKIEALKVDDSLRYDGEIQTGYKTSIRMPPQVIAPISNIEDLVGLNDEMETTIHRLTRGSKQLNVVPIVGMPGLGKTTLAKKVYCDPTIKFHFHILAWCTVSQLYNKHNLLLQILCGIVPRKHDQYLKQNEDDLAEELKRVLLRNRYLIILDDIWDIEAWNLLERSLPDDANGSRILFTSRSQNLSLQIKPDSNPHSLRQLTDSESWELLQNKLFGKDFCPPTLSKVVLQIAKSCKGLPLSVVLVSGILATTKQDCWENFANSLSYSNLLDSEHCMMTLEKSYSHLPYHLRPCLLYFGAFLEDQDIPVQRLLWLWISEGFVRKTEGRSLEAVANDYLMDLVGRSLVMVTRKKTLGGAKACRIHDLVHEFCVSKAKEQSFLEILHGHNDLFAFTGLSDAYRLCIYSSTIVEFEKSRLFFPNLHCLLSFGTGYGSRYTFLYEFPMLLTVSRLRVLDLVGFEIVGHFPMEVIILVHLRYLVIRLNTHYIPSAIANLSKLQTFVVMGSLYLVVKLPNTIRNMKTLRHLCVTKPRSGFSRSGFSFPVHDNLEVLPDLHDLDTFTLAIDSSSQSSQKILKKLPSIRKLRCVGFRSRESTGNCNRTLMLDCLSRVESLKLHRLINYEFEFPLNLKKLTLSSNRQPWSEISKIGKLPKLEVLKLCPNSFVGEKWEMKEGEFSHLRFLKLSCLDIRSWTASSDNFSHLENLVLHHCRSLEEVPSCLGDSETLEMIQVVYCSKSTVSSAKEIQREQMELGNEGLMVIINENFTW